MNVFIARRILSAIPVLIGVTLMVFSMLHLIPGDPVEAMFHDVENMEEIPEETIIAIRKKLGLDQPLHIQYLRFLGRALRGDLGESIVHERPVSYLIARDLPFSIQLGLCSMIFSVIMGVGLGIVAALNRGAWLDTLTMMLATFGVSMPNFWFGLLAILIFSVQLGWFPTSGIGGIKYLVLPTVTLGLSSAAVLARLTRSSLLETLGEDYIRTARAKGLVEQSVIWRHAFRNALIPVVTVIGLRFGALVGGSVVTEAVFARRGIGSLTISALTGKDFPLAQGLVLMLAGAYVTANLLVDLLYGVIDPRIRYE